MARKPQGLGIRNDLDTLHTDWLLYHNAVTSIKAVQDARTIRLLDREHAICHLPWEVLNSVILIPNQRIMVIKLLALRTGMDRVNAWLAKRSGRCHKRFEDICQVSKEVNKILDPLLRVVGGKQGGIRNRYAHSEDYPKVYKKDSEITKECLLPGVSPDLLALDELVLNFYNKARIFYRYQTGRQVPLYCGGEAVSSDDMGKMLFALVKGSGSFCLVKDEIASREDAEGHMTSDIAGFGFEFLHDLFVSGRFLFSGFAPHYHEILHGNPFIPPRKSIRERIMNQ